MRSVSKIHIRNFKAFSNMVSIDLSNVTLLSGLNSSGKSTIYHALLLLKQSTGTYYVDELGNRIPYLNLNGRYVCLGGVDDILNDVTVREVEFGLEYEDGVRARYVFSADSDKGCIGWSPESVGVLFLSCVEYVDSVGISFYVSAQKKTWDIRARQYLSFSDYDVYRQFSDVWPAILAKRNAMPTIGARLTENVMPDIESIKMRMESVESRMGRFGSRFDEPNEICRVGDPGEFIKELQTSIVEMSGLLKDAGDVVSSLSDSSFWDFEGEEDDVTEDVTRGAPFSEYVEVGRAYRVNLQDGMLRSFSIPFDDAYCLMRDDIRNDVDYESIKNNIVKANVCADEINLCASNLESESYVLLRGMEINFIRPFRGEPKRIYVTGRDESPLANFGKTRKATIHFSYSFDTGKPQSGKLSSALDYWLTKEFGLGGAIRAVDSYSSLVHEVIVSHDKNKSIALNNVGFGVSQVIPVVYQSLISNSDCLILIDEPEVHLHPSAQSKLADFFSEMAMLGKKIIIETHSEYLIDKIIFNSIKYKEVGERVRMFWVEKGVGGGSVIPVKYDELGYVTNQPSGFLSEKKKLVAELAALRLERLANE